MAEGKVVGLDIGTSMIRVAIGELDPDTGSIRIAGTASRKSAGLRNGVIVNIEDAKNAIKETIDAAEQNAGTTVDSVITAIGGSQIESQNSRGTVPVSSANKSTKEISRADVERVIECATAIKVPDDREKLHVIPQNYIVDGIGGITDPIHRMGTRLEAEVHIVTAAKTIIQNIRSCISRSDYMLDGVMLKTLAQTQSVCHQDEMELGSILIDMGAGTTDVLLLLKGAPIGTFSIPVGGNLVTNDIAVVNGIPIATAEKIKLEYGCCYPQMITEENDSDICLPGVGGQPPGLVKKSEITEIITARMTQILTMAKQAIIKNTADIIKDLSGNIILTGGAANMEGVVPLTGEVFHTRAVRVGIPESLGGLEEEYRRPEYSAAIGLVVANKGIVAARTGRKKSKRPAGSNNGDENKEGFLKRLRKLFF
jgi:cell division protein FtsA